MSALIGFNLKTLGTLKMKAKKGKKTNKQTKSPNEHHRGNGDSNKIQLRNHFFPLRVKLDVWCGCMCLYAPVYLCVNKQMCVCVCVLYTVHVTLCFINESITHRTWHIQWNYPLRMTHKLESARIQRHSTHKIVHSRLLVRPDTTKWSRLWTP